MSNSERKGRQWTWERWDRLSKDKKGSNYVTASALAGFVFLCLLCVALIMKAVAPTPSDLDDYPLALAKRITAQTIFTNVVLPDCELAALNSIKEPYRSFAKKTGWFEPEAFPSALVCLDEHIKETGLPPLEDILRSENGLGPVSGITCTGSLRDTDVCENAFSLTKSKSKKIGLSLVLNLTEKIQK